MPLVFIILLNYGGAADTLACLESLQALDYENFRIVVVDNASPDNSVELLRQTKYDFHLIQSSKNLGYSGGNNLGIQYALEQGADYIWLLNNDTTVDPKALKSLINESQRTGGLAGSLLRYPDGTFQQVGTRIKWTTGSTRGIPERDVREGMSVDCLTGASLLIPTPVLQQIGLLEESFFLYFEDGEYTLRATRAGFPATITTESIVYHKEGATTGRKSLRTQYYYHRNRLKLLYQYANELQKQTIALYTVFRFIRSIIKTKLKPSPERKASLKVEWLALQDFKRGVSGPCPHDLSKV